jgi:hemolysin-activating ACP:hemolysin acyltransferase
MILKLLIAIVKGDTRNFFEILEPAVTEKRPEEDFLRSTFATFNANKNLPLAEFKNLIVFLLKWVKPLSHNLEVRDRIQIELFKPDNIRKMMTMTSTDVRQHLTA